MPQQDGDGWVDCSCGSRHWGLHGAAGVAVVHPDSETLLLQQRASWTHGGATWALPGGALDSHEDPVSAALRELNEELGVGPELIQVLGNELLFDHGDWTYHTILATIPEQIQVRHNAESVGVAWVPFGQVLGFELHPSFASTWSTLELWISSRLNGGQE